MEKTNIDRFRGLELSVGMIEKLLKESKTAQALNKFGMGSYIESKTWINLNSRLNEYAYKDYLMPMYVRNLKSEDLSKSQIVEHMYRFCIHASEKRGMKHSYNYSTGYKLKDKLKFVEKTSQIYKKYNTDGSNLLNVSDTAYFIFQNQTQYSKMLKSLFGFMQNDDRKDFYKEICAIEQTLTTIPTSANTIDFGDLNLTIKFNSAFNKFNDFNDGTNNFDNYNNILAYSTKSSSLADNLFKMLKFSDIHNHSFDLKKALDSYKESFENQLEVYSDDTVYDSDGGFNTFEYIKNSSEGLFNISISTIKDNEELEELYKIWRWQIIHPSLWNLDVIDGSNTEIEHNQSYMDGSYYYGKKTSIYDKVTPRDSKEYPMLIEDLEYIKKTIQFEYILLNSIYYSSKEIDSLINTNDESERSNLISLIFKINLALTKASLNVSIPHLITRESTLFPNDCPYQYALISISCRPGETLEISEEDSIESSYINYYDSENIELLNSSISELHSLLKKYKVEA